MQKNDILLFNKLQLDRLDSARILEKRSMEGFKKSVVEKYPESAHFIYELLQNADDAEATSVYINLTHDGLLFKHNGSIGFTITDEDDYSIKLGHLNAITAVANSPKEEDPHKIGKFGVGFKSVFQYTNCPQVYDDNFWFEIRNFFVPYLLEQDHPLRKSGETLFFFPFVNKEKSYKEVKNRLSNLDNPILFLRHLENVVWCEGIETFVYKKEIEKDYSYLCNGEARCTLTRVTNLNKDDLLIIFEKEVCIENTHFPINIAYYLDKDGRLNLEVDPRAFCFFPTKEKFFGKHFIGHAPFDLVDSRQNFKQDNKTNEFLKIEIAKLSAFSLPVLRDIGIDQNIQLINENIFSLINTSPYYAYFDNFVKYCYTPELEILKSKELILCQDGKYHKVSESICYYPQTITKLLDNSHLKYLCKKQKPSFIIEQINQKINQDSTIESYCRRLSMTKVTIEEFAKVINPEFMEAQSLKWVQRFYSYILSYDKKSIDPKGCLRHSPIIKTSIGTWIMPYQNDGTANVFLPIGVDIEGLHFVDEDHYAQESIRKFYMMLGLKEPDREDYIKTVILKKYKESKVDIDSIELKKEFELILSHYINLQDSEKQLFVKALIDGKYQLYNGSYLYFPNELYLKTDSLVELFRYRKDDKPFFSFDFYKKSIEKHGIDIVNQFIEALGVTRYILVKEKNGWDWDVKKRLIDEGKETGYTFVDIDDYQFEELPVYLAKKKEIPLFITKLIWESLVHAKLDKYKCLKYYYKVYKGKSVYFSSSESSLICTLKNTKWLLNKYPQDVYIEDLNSAGIIVHDEVCSLFSIRKKNSKYTETGMSEDEAKTHELIDFLLSAGVPRSKIEETLKDLKDQASQEKSNAANKSDNTHQEQREDYADKVMRDMERMKNAPNNKPKPAGASSFMSMNDNEVDHSDDSVFGDSNTNDKPKNSSISNRDKANLERRKTEATNDLEEIQNETDIKNKLDVTQKYTYQWFELLLGLQKLKRKDPKKKELQFTYYKYELSEDGGMLTLKQPTCEIPMWVNDSSNIQLGIYAPTPTEIDAKIVSIDIEAGEFYFDVREQKNIKEILQKTKKIVVSCQNDANVFDSLMQRFAQLNYDKNFSLKDNLTNNIKFIYGPPGTGKTTEVIKKIAEKIKVAEKNGTKMNILVLTPTNKAADVIAESIILNRNDQNLPVELRNDAETCYPYLCRYGFTNSEICIYDEGDIVYNRDNMKMGFFDCNIVVTTIARFAYDYVIGDNNEPVDICDFKWNFIFFDEASMIDLIQIMYALHKASQNNTCFVISGDPKQIPPVTGDPYYTNIYECLDIRNLKYARDYYKDYPIQPLLTQYRSIPDIGNLVSLFSYDGLVKGTRDEQSAKPLIIDGFDFKHINFLGFEVKDFSLLYATNKLGQSPITIYTIVFAYEMVKNVVSNIRRNHSDIEYTIGIVSPYRAEADAIRQLFENNPVGVNITCGTVHSFQGDQCDIMFYVMNPSDSHSWGTNANKEDIFNVAISRARDYLFIIAPSGKSALHILRKAKVEVLDAHSIPYTETKCSDVEKVIFGQENWIECNTSISGHSNVNTYSEQQSVYDIRISDTAIDIRRKI